MKISIVVPAYNAEKWIKTCLDSIVSQTYRNLEIILLNDGSNDKTLNIISSYAERDERIKVIDKKNSGTYLTRKLGFRESTGEAIFNADADDHLQSNAIELLVARMKETNADMVVGNHYQLLNAKKKLIKNKLPINQCSLELIRCLLNNDIKGYVWGKLYKRELLTEINYEVTHLLQEDVLFNLHVFMNKEMTVALEPIPIYNYVIHKNSANSSKNPVFIENVHRFINMTEAILKTSNCLPKLADDFRLFKCRNWIVYSRLGGNLAKDRNFRSQFYKENYTGYAKLNLQLHHNIEMLAYRYNYHFGRFTTNSMKRLNNLIH